MDLISILLTAEEAICGNAVIIDFVSKILTIIQIVVPILLIIFGSIDLAKAVMAGKDDEIKKSQMTFVKRAIAAVIVFFVPFVVNMILGLVPVGDNGQGEAITWQKCRDYAKTNQQQ